MILFLILMFSFSNANAQDRASDKQTIYAVAGKIISDQDNPDFIYSDDRGSLPLRGLKNVTDERFNGEFVAEENFSLQRKYVLNDGYCKVALPTNTKIPVCKCEGFKENNSSKETISFNGVFSRVTPEGLEFVESGNRKINLKKMVMARKPDPNERAVGHSDSDPSNYQLTAQETNGIR